MGLDRMMVSRTGGIRYSTIAVTTAVQDMVKLKEREITEKPKLETVDVKASFTIPTWTPPIPPTITLDYQIPSYRRLFERIWWDDGRRWDNGFYLNLESWKPCQHYKCEVKDTTDVLSAERVPWITEALIGARYYTSYGERTTLDRLIATDHPTFRSFWGKFGEHIAQLTPMYGKVSDDGFIAKPSGISTIVQLSLKATLPSIKSNLSLINSVIELKDFRTIGRTLSNCVRLMKWITENSAKNSTVITLRGAKAVREFRKENPFAKIRSTFAVEHGMTLREALSSTADGYLQAKFNLMPLFRDIQALQKAIRDVGKQINKLVNNQGKRQFKHFSYKWLNGDYSGPNQTLGPLSFNTGQFAGSAGEGTGCWRYWPHGIRFERKVSVDPSHFHAQVEYNYYFTQAQNEHARLYGFYDALGINLDPSIIWNAIPWSFLVDWLFDVSRWLGNKKVLNLEPGVNISRYLWSWKQTRKVTTFFESTTNLAQRPIRTYLPTLYETIYRRDLKMPTRTDPLFGGGLSSTELSLGGALVITRVFPQNRRLALTKQLKALFKVSPNRTSSKPFPKLNRLVNDLD